MTNNAKRMISLMNKRTDFNVKNYKIISADEIFYEEMAYYGFATTAVSENFSYDYDMPCKTKNSQNHKFTKEEAIKYIDNVKTNAIHILERSRTYVKTFRESSGSITDKELFIAFSTLFKNSDQKELYRIFMEYMSGNTEAIKGNESDLMVIAFTPFTNMINMRNSSNCELLDKLSAYSDVLSFSIFGNGDLITDSTRNQFNDLSLHTPFDKCILIFGPYAVRYEKKGNYAEFTISCIRGNEFADILATRVDLDHNGCIKVNEGSNAPIISIYNLIHCNEFMQDMKDIYILSKLSQNFMFSQALAEMGTNVNMLSDLDNNAFKVIEDRDIDMDDFKDRTVSHVWSYLASYYFQAIIDSFVMTTLFLTSKHIRIDTVPLYVEKKSKNKKSSGPNVQKIEYSTIRVTVGQEINEASTDSNEVDSSSNHSVTPHIRRGHFKLYTKDKPLFGKYTGLIWFDQAMIGNGTPKNTDYEVSM